MNDIDRFRWVYAKELDINYINDIVHSSVRYTLDYGRDTDRVIGTYGGTIGCYLSHLKLWEMLLKSNEDMYLILEDDVCPNENYNIENINLLVNNVNKIDPQWNLIFIGFIKPTMFNSSKDIEIKNETYMNNYQM